MWKAIKRLRHSLAHLLGLNHVVIETTRSKHGFLITRAKCIGCGQYVDDEP